MKRKTKIVLMIVIGVFLLFAYNVNPFFLNKFSNLLTKENLTFTEKENITRYLKINKYSNVSYASLNISGILIGSIYNVITISGLGGNKDDGNWNTYDWIDNRLCFYSGDYNCEPPDHIDGYTSIECWNFSENSWVSLNNGGPTTCFLDSFPEVYCYFDYATQNDLPSSCIFYNSSEEKSYVKIRTYYDYGIQGSVTRQDVSGSVIESYDIEGKLLYAQICNETDGYFAPGPAPYTDYPCFKIGPEFYFYDTYFTFLRYWEQGLIYNRTFENGSSPSNVWLEIGTPDGTYEWNWSGDFNSSYSPQKTKNLNDSINLALNNGLCDCEGCSLSNFDCYVPFVFHSDSAGKLRYDSLNITYSLPSPNTPEPYFNTTLAYNLTNLECSVIPVHKANLNMDIFFNLTVNGIYKAEYSVENVSNGTLVTWIIGKGNYTKHDNISCLVTFYDGENSKSNYTNITILNSVPTTPSLINPLNNTGSTHLQLCFNGSTDDDNDALTFYLVVDNNSDFSSPEYVNSSIVQQTLEQTCDTISISEEGLYYWRVLANDGEANSSWSETWQFFYDLTSPNITILSPSNGATFINTLTVGFSTNATDNHRVEKCWYWYDYLGGGLVRTNTTYDCTSTTIEFPTYSAYTIYFYAQDNVSYEDYDTINFTLEYSYQAPGGGGGGVTTQIPIAMKIETLLGTKEARLVSSSGELKTEEFNIYNLGTDTINVFLRCESATEICDWIEFEKETYTVEPSEIVPTRAKFIINIPDEVTGEYSFTIKAISGKTEAVIKYTLVIYPPFSFINFLKNFFELVTIKGYRLPLGYMIFFSLFIPFLLLHFFVFKFEREKFIIFSIILSIASFMATNLLVFLLK